MGSSSSFLPPSHPTPTPDPDAEDAALPCLSWSSANPQSQTDRLGPFCSQPYIFFMLHKPIHSQILGDTKEVCCNLKLRTILFCKTVPRAQAPASSSCLAMFPQMDPARTSPSTGLPGFLSPFAGRPGSGDKEVGCLQRPDRGGTLPTRRYRRPCWRAVPCPLSGGGAVRHPPSHTSQPEPASELLRSP